MLVAPHWTGLYLGLGLLLSSCLVLPNAHGQSDFKRGYVIQANGDTLHGQIRNRRFFRSPEQFRFRRSESATVQTFGIEDSVTVFVVGNRRFERHTVQVDQRPITGASPNPPNIRPRKTVFLQQLVDGRLTLYYYRDDRRHFYLETPEKGPYELIRYVRLVEQRGLKRAQHILGYRQQLLSAQTDACQTDEIANLDYEVEPLTAFVQRCNGISPTAENARTTQNWWTPTLDHRLRISAGRTKASYVDDLPPALFANGWGTVKVGYTAVLSPKYYSRVGALLLHAGVSRFSLKGTTAETFYGSTFEASVRGVAAQLAASYQYRFGTGRLRPFIEVGSVTSFALSHDYSIDEDLSETVRDDVGPFRWQGAALGVLGSLGLERPPFSAALRLYWQPRRVVFANGNTPQLRSLFLSFSYEL